MPDEIAHSMNEMIAMNRRFWNRAKITKIDQGLIKYPSGGVLFSSIALQPINQFKVNVIALDYGEAGEKSAEIEYGLKTPEFRRYSEYPKLKQWVVDKGKYSEGKGIVVGNSPAGIPHPQGLHYFELGFETAYASSNIIITEELSKLA